MPQGQVVIGRIQREEPDVAGLGADEIGQQTIATITGAVGDPAVLAYQFELGIVALSSFKGSGIQVGQCVGIARQKDRTRKGDDPCECGQSTGSEWESAK